MKVTKSKEINRKYIIIFREEATSAFVGFHADHLSRLTLNLGMLVFVEGGRKT